MTVIIALLTSLCRSQVSMGDRKTRVYQNIIKRKGWNSGRNAKEIVNRETWGERVHQLERSGTKTVLNGRIISKNTIRNNSGPSTLGGT